MPKVKRIPTGITVRPSKEMLRVIRDEVKKRLIERQEEWSHAEILDEMRGSWERDRLKQSSLNGGNSDSDSLTPTNESVIIRLLTEEKEWVDKLVSILRHGDAGTVEQIQRDIRLLLQNIEGVAHVGKAKPKREAGSRKH